MEARFQARQQRQEIELLKKNEAINLLQSEARSAEIARLGQVRAQEAKLRNLALVALALLACLAALLYHRMRASTRANRIISSKNAQLEALDRIVRALNHSSDASIVWQAVAEHLMGEIHGVESLAIWRFNNRVSQFELAANLGPHAALRPASLQIREAEWRFFSRGREIRPGVYWAHAEGVQQGGDELILTIDYELRKVGFMVLAGSRQGRDLDEGELASLARFREYVITALARAQVLEQLNGEKARAEAALRELQQLNAHLVELATHDPLTGLANRRMILDTIGREMVRFERHGRPFSLLLLDVDHFKRLNDTFGHLCGDEILKLLAGQFTRQTRKGDLVARWGGEEFLFFLPETDGEGAQLLAERVRSQVEQAAFSYKGEPTPVTLTIGLTTFSGGKTTEQLIHACDEALYAGKASGRNQVRATA
jgi:diguanylate cyclase (GGDEF)-like protein